MDVDAFAALLADHGDRVAAFIGEPVIGAGGVVPAGGWLLAARSRSCAVATMCCWSPTRSSPGSGGPGGCGASSGTAIVPDLLVFAKGATSGYQPLGGVLVGAAGL